MNKKISFLTFIMLIFINSTKAMEKIDLDKYFADLPVELKHRTLSFYCGTNLTLDKMAARLIKTIEENDKIGLGRVLNCIKFLYSNPSDQTKIFTAEDSLGYPAIISPMVHDSYELGLILLDHIKTMDQSAQTQIIESTDKDRVNALSMSIMKKSPRTTRKILNILSNLPQDVQVKIFNTSQRFNKYTPLMKAVSISSPSSVKIVRMLLEHIKNFEKANIIEILRAKNTEQKTPLQMATKGTPSKSRTQIKRMLEEAEKHLK